MEATVRNARIAGLLFLLMVAAGLFSEIFFRQKLFASDAAVAAQAILDNVLLYRFGVLSDIVMSLAYLFTALALYRLLSGVDKMLAVLMVLLAASGSVLLLANIQNELAPLGLVEAGRRIGGSEEGRFQALAMLSYQAYGHGYMIGQVFFASWVLPLGILIYRSAFLPKAFGILFIIETVCGSAAVAVHFLFPSETVESLLLLTGTVAELSFMIWILVKGVDLGKVVRKPMAEASV